MTYKEYLVEFIKKNVLEQDDVYQLEVKHSNSDISFGGDIDRLLDKVKTINDINDDVQKVFNIDLQFKDIKNPKWQRQVAINLIESMVRSKIHFEDAYIVVQPNAKVVSKEPYTVRISIVINKGNPVGKSIGTGNKPYIPTWL